MKKPENEGRSIGNREEKVTARGKGNRGEKVMERWINRKVVETETLRDQKGRGIKEVDETKWIRREQKCIGNKRWREQRGGGNKKV